MYIHWYTRLSSVWEKSLRAKLMARTHAPSVLMARTHAPSVLIRSFAAVHWIYFWNTLLKQRDWAQHYLQGAHQGPSSAARERNPAHSPPNTKIHALCFTHGKNTRRKSFAKAEVTVFDGQNVVICCKESERDPVHIASLEERKRWNSLDKFRCWAK